MTPLPTGRAGATGTSSPAVCQAVNSGPTTSAVGAPAPRVEYRAPVRIQRKRTKDWRMPDGARYVGRPSRWGNPFSAIRGSVIGPKWFDVKDWPLTRGVRLVDDELLELYSSHSSHDSAVEASVRLFRDLVMVRLRDRPAETLRWLAPLTGRNLACWCPEDRPFCHADVLLELANPNGAHQ